MKRLAVIGLMFAFVLAAQEFKVPNLTGRVVDQAKILTSQEKVSLEESCKQFEKKTKGQFAVCIVPEMPGESVESASIKVAEKWKIGNKGKDNGMLFFLTMKEREFRIEVGYGFEGKMTDGKAGEIGRLVIPKFKEKKWHDGIKYIIDASGQVLAGEKTLEQLKEETQPDKVTIIVIGIIIGLIILVVFISMFSDSDGTYISGGGGSSGGYRGSSYSSFGGSSFRGGGFSGGGGSFGGGGFSGKF